uniref:pentatricopeptide repeat-containing protein At3g22150, chloroplastic n=1 Tax=Erigeron canadensis TaxID=72917 RepID=UPI001CB8B468|nr:pentatricopeptide repeat-containing protein At3g22150, chloroplastic [Erigeron canadensis]XP_043630733.1 pentatricopeptide repeat-containing protein At3g22150, chloroplastic [Erigeron canadensis]XP_043630735.1 pentatricopeptide repeat-containing protein At3g22150, chloroplastic [Erigeron canadensis]XP_043630736.1 pentatricopeptide repeat-containing protein At3g22150, chloroplastic [Erigeron canadensis]XP_043630737.1 pentatricopeptide repeat-containing protein At3g22150, chloroplastic [Eriger
MSSSSSSSQFPLPTSINSYSSQNHQTLYVSSLPLSSPSNIPSPNIQWTKDQSYPHPKPRTIRYRLSQLCREGQPHLARQLFDEIPKPTTVVWNAIIIGLICNGMAHEAILLYSQMKCKSFLCDSYTYSSVLKACAETRSLRIGKAVHCHVLRSDMYPSRIVCNSLLNMYASCMYDGVKRVFDSMPKRNVISWNILVSWYVKVGVFAEAVSHFVKMIKSGVKPTPVSFVNVFPAVAAMGESRIGDAVYGLLVKLGDEYSTDVFATSSAISMFSELGSLESARKIFDNSLERNIEIWNTMIGGYVQNKMPLEALDLFIQALQAADDVAIDSVTLTSVLTAVSQLQQLDLANQIHAYIIKSVSVLPVIVMNTLVVMYSRCNSIQESLKVFKSMNERDSVSWNTMISSLVQNGMNDESLLLVSDMQKQRFIIDDVTISAVLSAASNLRNQEIGKQAHGYLLRHNIQFEGVESYLIDMYAKSGLIKVAQDLFERTCSKDLDQATWNSMIAGNSQSGLIEEAFNVFRQMVGHNIPPNAVTIASILPGCSMLGSSRLAKQLHAFTIRSYLDHNVFVNSALVDTYSKLGRISSAENVFVLSHEKNAVTYTNMILGYGQHGMVEKSLHLFTSMREHGIEPDSVTIVAILCACSYSGLVDEGLQLFESMEVEYKIVPSVEHYCCVVDMLGRVGRVSEAYNFVKTLGENGNHLRIWGSLLGYCRIYGEFQLGKVVASKLVEMGVGNKNAGYNVLLSNMYAEEGNWKFVDRLTKEMYEKGIAKETGHSWIDNGGRMDYFMSRHKNHSHSDEIYEMLDVLDTDLTTE